MMKNSWNLTTVSDRNKILSEKTKEFAALAQMTQEILDSGKETPFLKKYDISKSAYRKMLMLRIKGYENPKFNLIPDSYSILTWQEKIFDYIYPWVEYRNYPIDIDESVDYILANDQCFTEEEKEIADLYFKYETSIEKIAEIKGISYEYAKDTLNVFSYKMSYGEKGLILKYGLDNATAITRLRKKLSKEKRRNAIGELINSIRETKFSNDIEKLKQEYTAAGLIIEKYKQEEKDECQENVRGLEDIEMPNRLRNLLYRNKVHNMDDFVVKKMFVVDNMLNIHGCGQETIFSIIRLCYQHKIPVEAYSPEAKKLYQKIMKEAKEQISK